MYCGFFVDRVAEIKSLSSIRDKWTRVTPGRTEDYKIGVQNPKRDWEAETVAAKDNWKAGIDAAAGKDMFAKGVVKAGSKKWQARTMRKVSHLIGKRSPGSTLARSSHAGTRETLSG
jgi:secreted Zn-dependent insulinase-like peptidase